MERVYLTVADVEIIHTMVLEHSGGSAGLRDRGALESGVFRPQSGYYADLIEEAAALMESLAGNHPFVDGNKRTAVVAVQTFLDYNGHSLEADADETNEFFLKNLREGTFRFGVIRDWLREKVRKAAKR
ncbi:MAG: type II toxin-antitoxin system death-on-curing family toxin [Candidatus Acidiferrales bacterium]